MTELQNNPKGLLLIVCGAAGTGKGTIVSEMMKKSDRFAFSVSATTRAPRPGEVDGVNYHFITKEEFKSGIEKGKFIEYTQYCGNYYGTPASELKKLDEGMNLILEVEVEGAGNIKRLCPDSVAVFITTPDFKVLRQRLVGRKTNTPEDIENRLKRALVEYGMIELFDYTVVNDENGVEDAANRIIEIVKCEQHRVFRNIDALDKRFPGRVKLTNPPKG